MDAGAYRESIEIQIKDGDTIDSIGNRKEKWKTHYRGYAYVNNLSGTEYWAAAQTHAENTVVFTLRYHPRLKGINTLGSRLCWKGAVYNITFIDNVQNKNETIKIRAYRKE